MLLFESSFRVGNLCLLLILPPSSKLGQWEDCISQSNQLMYRTCHTIRAQKAAWGFSGTSGGNGNILSLFWRDGSFRNTHGSLREKNLNPSWARNRVMTPREARSSWDGIVWIPGFTHPWQKTVATLTRETPVSIETRLTRVFCQSKEPRMLWVYHYLRTIFWNLFINWSNFY